MQAAEHRDQKQNRDRHAQKPQQKITSHDVSLQIAISRKTAPPKSSSILLLETVAMAATL